MIRCEVHVFRGEVNSYLGFVAGAFGCHRWDSAIGVAYWLNSSRRICDLLSGLNPAVVGIIALAVVQLAEKALTRIVVFLDVSACSLYNALWYYPVIVLYFGRIETLLKL